MSLPDLPPPLVVQTLDYTALRNEAVEDFAERLDDKGIPYDVETLETDPGVVVLEEHSYRETLVRGAINEAAKSNLRAFATGTDLDHLAAWHEVYRMPGETNARLNDRLGAHIRGRRAGTKEHYRALAMDADIRVTDPAVYVSSSDPRVNIAIFASDNNGVADNALLTAVRNHIAEEMAVVNDTVVVHGAVAQVVNIAARYWLLPGASATNESLETGLRSAWEAESGLGFDMPRAWLEARLMQAGVRRLILDAPVADIVVPFNKWAAIGTVTLTFMGREY